VSDSLVDGSSIEFLTRVRITREGTAGSRLLTGLLPSQVGTIHGSEGMFESARPTPRRPGHNPSG
jgi:hypothetical protein